MSFVEQINSLPKAMQPMAVAEFLFENGRGQIESAFAERIKQLAGHLPSDAPAASLEVDQIKVEAIEDHPAEEPPSNNVMGWAVWKSGDIEGNYHFDIDDDDTLVISWLTVTLHLPTEIERRDAEEEWA
jgi:hypothetical protein